MWLWYLSHVFKVVVDNESCSEFFHDINSGSPATEMLFVSCLLVANCCPGWWCRKRWEKYGLLLPNPTISAVVFFGTKPNHISNCHLRFVQKSIIQVIVLGVLLKLNSPEALVAAWLMRRPCAPPRAVCCYCWPTCRTCWSVRWRGWVSGWAQPRLYGGEVGWMGTAQTPLIQPIYKAVRTWM